MTEHLLQIAAISIASSAGHAGVATIGTRGFSRVRWRSAARLASGRRGAIGRRRIPFQANGNTLRHRLWELAHLRLGGNFELQGFLGRQVVDGQRAGSSVNTDNNSGDVSERARHNFVGGKLGAVGTTRAAGTQLIARLDVGYWGDSGFIKINGTRSVTAEDGDLAYVNGDIFGDLRR